VQQLDGRELATTVSDFVSAGVLSRYQGPSSCKRTTEEETKGIPIFQDGRGGVTQTVSLRLVGRLSVGAAN
jgi:hypothetical protein